MKKLSLLILVIILASSSVFAQQNGKSIRITGIDSRFTAFQTLYLSDNANYNNAQTVDIGVSPYNIVASFNNRTLTGPLQTSRHQQDFAENWNGSGDYFIILILIDWDNYGYYVYVSKNRISFRNAITEIAFSDFNFIERLQGQ